MIRILFPLFMALMAFFGPWKIGPGGPQQGFEFADTTVGCFIELDPSITGPCAPTGTLAERLVSYTVLSGAFAAVLSVFGLLPIVARITGLTTLVAGGIGIAATVFIVAEAAGGAGVSLVAWGAWATLVLAVLTFFAGLSGVRNGNE